MQAEMKAYISVKTYTHSFWDFLLYKSMNFRQSNRESLAKTRNDALNAEAKAKAAEYFLEVMILQYNTLLFNCEKQFMELINYKLYVDFIIPLFEGKTFAQYLIILMVRSLANVIFKKIWARLVLLRQRHLKTEENTKMQKELSQVKKMSDLADSATEQIHQKVGKILEPTLDKLLSRKIKVTALKNQTTKERSTL